MSFYVFTGHKALPAAGSCVRRLQTWGRSAVWSCAKGHGIKRGRHPLGQNAVGTQQNCEGNAKNILF